MSDEIKNKSEEKNTGITAGDVVAISAVVFFVGLLILGGLYIAADAIYSRGFRNGEWHNYEKCRAANIERPFECSL